MIVFYLVLCLFIGFVLWLLDLGFVALGVVFCWF